MSRRSSGFTLVEAIVGLALTALTFGILWGIFFYDNRRITASMERLTALRAGEAIVETLKSDLKNLKPPDPDTYNAWGGRPVLLESSGGDTGGGGFFDKLTLYRYVDSAGVSGRAQLITYRYDPATKRIYRGIDGDEGTLGASEFTDFLLDFRRQGVSEHLLYEIVTSFRGVSRMSSTDKNIRDMVFRGQIDLVDKTAQAARFRWVPSK